MKIIFIGTGSGQTSLQRFHSSLLIESGGFNLLIDTGDGISKALLSAGIDYKNISALLYTHMHPDHSAGLPSLLIQMKMLNRKDELLIYCHEQHKKNLTALLNYTHILPVRLDFQIRFETFSDNKLTDTGYGIKFKAAANSHLDDLKATLNNPDEAVSFGFMFYLKEHSIFYTGDVGSDQDLYKFRNEKADIIISEATHISFDQVMEAFRILKPGYLYLTHISDGQEFPSSDKIIAVRDKYEIHL